MCPDVMFCSFVSSSQLCFTPEVCVRTPHVTCLHVCVAGSVHALCPSDWAYSLHCVLHYWKHMCFLQVSVHSRDYQSHSGSWWGNHDGFISGGTSALKYLHVYTFVLILSYSTMFLMEPEKQLTLMFDETRVHATAAVIVSSRNLLLSCCSVSCLCDLRLLKGNK